MNNSIDFDDFIPIEVLVNYVDRLFLEKPKDSLTEEKLLFTNEKYFYKIVDILDCIENDLRRKDSKFWKEYNYKLNSINKEILIKIPQKDNIRYRELRELESTHLTNNRLVLELIIRNNEFKELFFNADIVKNNTNYEDYEKKYVDICKKLKEDYGFNIRETLKLKANIPYYNEIYKIKEQANDYSITNAPFINDIDNGVNRVIKFYYNEKKLYIIGSVKFHECSDYDNIDKEALFVKVIEKKYFEDTLDNYKNKIPFQYIKYEIFQKYNKIFIRIDECFYEKICEEKLVEENINDDFIKRNIDDLAIEVEIFGRKIKHLVNNDKFSLELVDKNFINTLTEYEKMDIEIRAQEGISFVEYNIPILSFSGSRLINFQINLDSSEHDIINSIKQLKEESKKVKTSNQILYSKHRDDQKIMISNKIISKGNKKIINFADALYTYDLYKILEKEFNKIRFELIVLNKIFKKPNSINLDKSLRELDVNSIKREIMKLLDIGETVYYNRLKLIKDFLKNKNYKQILLGNLEIKI